MPASEAPLFESIYWSDHWAVDVDVSHRVVRLVRSSVPIHSPNEVSLSFYLMREALEHLDLHDWGLILDIRAAKPSRDPEIEEAFRQNRKRFKAPFDRMAILLGTAIGVLQVRRMIEEAPDPTIRLVSEPDDAMEWAQTIQSIPFGGA